MAERKKFTKAELKALPSGSVLTDGYEHYFKGDRLLVSQGGSIWTFAEATEPTSLMTFEVAFTAEKR